MANGRAEARLEAAVGSKGVVRDPLQLRAMSTPWRDSWASKPLLAVMPASTEEVQAVVRICREEGLPMVPQGGNTGMTGGGLCRPDGEDVLISLRRMDKVRLFDVDDCMMIAEAGCVLANIKAVAAEYGLLFPLSLGAQGSCMIGGNIATNAGGINALRYGTTRNLIAGLEVVLPDGQVWNGLRRLRKDNAGYDLKQFFIGSEGTLGIVTAATLLLSPLPRSTATAFVAVRDPAAALTWLRRLRATLGESLTACELIERICLDVAIKHHSSLTDPLQASYPWYVLTEAAALTSDGSLADRIADAFSAAFDAGEVLDGTIATSQSQADMLWKLRESLAEGHRHEGVSYKHDVSVPVSRVPAFIDTAERALSERFPGIRQFAFGHLGDGNIHYNSIQAAGEPPELWAPRLAEVNRIVHDIVYDLGGSITAEHGIGQLRRDELTRYKSEVEMRMLRAVKATFDPNNLMNPGKLLT